MNKIFFNAFWTRLSKFDMIKFNIKYLIKANN